MAEPPAIFGTIPFAGPPYLYAFGAVLEMMIPAGIFGGIVGAVVGPVLGWTLLRRVPLGRGIAWCVAGAVVGACSAIVSPGTLIPGALAGSVFAAACAWVAHRTRSPGG